MMVPDHAYWADSKKTIAAQAKRIEELEHETMTPEMVSLLKSTIRERNETVEAQAKEISAHKSDKELLVAEINELRAALQRPDRAELQAEGKHPAPCAKFCEATAFGIEIRSLNKRLESMTADRDDCLALSKLSWSKAEQRRQLCDLLGNTLQTLRFRSINDEPVDTAIAAWRNSK